jgi:hypothetical protein
MVKMLTQKRVNEINTFLKILKEYKEDHQEDSDVNHCDRLAFWAQMIVLTEMSKEQLERYNESMGNKIK